MHIGSPMNDEKDSFAALKNLSLYHPSKEYTIPFESIPGNGVSSIRYHGELLAYFRHVKVNETHGTSNNCPLHGALGSSSTTSPQASPKPFDFSVYQANFFCTCLFSNLISIPSCQSNGMLVNTSYQTQVRVWSLAYDSPVLAFSYHWNVWNPLNSSLQIPNLQKPVPPSWATCPSIQASDLALSDKLLSFVVSENKLVYARLCGSKIFSATDIFPHINNTTSFSPPINNSKKDNSTHSTGSSSSFPSAPNYEPYAYLQTASTNAPTAGYPNIHAQPVSNDKPAHAVQKEDFSPSPLLSSPRVSPGIETLDLEPILKYHNVTHTVTVKALCWKGYICLIMQGYGTQSANNEMFSPFPQGFNRHTTLKHTTILILIKIPFGSSKKSSQKENSCRYKRNRATETADLSPVILTHSLLETSLPIHHFSSEGVLRKVGSNHWIVIFEYFDRVKRVHMNALSINSIQPESDNNNSSPNSSSKALNSFAARNVSESVKVINLMPYSSRYLSIFHPISFSKAVTYKLYSKSTGSKIPMRVPKNFRKKIHPDAITVKQSITTLVFKLVSPKTPPTTASSLRDLACSFAEPLRCVVASDTSTISAVTARLNSPWALPVALVHILLFFALAPLLLLKVRSGTLEIQIEEILEEKEDDCFETSVNDESISSPYVDGVAEGKSDIYTKHVKLKTLPSKLDRSLRQECEMECSSNMTDEKENDILKSSWIPWSPKSSGSNNSRSWLLFSSNQKYSLPTLSSSPTTRPRSFTSASDTLQTRRPSSLRKRSYREADSNSKKLIFESEKVRPLNRWHWFKKTENENENTLSPKQSVFLSSNTRLKTVLAKTKTCSFNFKSWFDSLDDTLQENTDDNCYTKNKGCHLQNINTPSWNNYDSVSGEINIPTLDPHTYVRTIKAGKNFYGVVDQNGSYDEGTGAERPYYNSIDISQSDHSKSCDCNHSSHKQKEIQKSGTDTLDESKAHDKSYFSSHSQLPPVNQCQACARNLRFLKFTPTITSQSAYKRPQTLRNFSTMCSFVCLGVLSASVFALYKLVPSARLDLLAQLALADAVSVFLLAWCQDAVRIAIDVKWKWWVWIRRRQIAKKGG